jgi:hypothetical protein
VVPKEEEKKGEAEMSDKHARKKAEKEAKAAAKKAEKEAKAKAKADGVEPAAEAGKVDGAQAKKDAKAQRLAERQTQ